jgi:hypothetical protein
MFRILNPIPNARANYNAEPIDNLPVVRLAHSFAGHFTVIGWKMIIK